MKQILIISGKGGTGKTSLTAEFARLAQQAVIADCDVDAANLSLLLLPEGGAAPFGSARSRSVPSSSAPSEGTHQEPFYSGFAVVYDADQCTGCGLCAQACRFDAISTRPAEAPAPALKPEPEPEPEPAPARANCITIDHLSCEGCGACVDVCPNGALTLRDKPVGHLYSAHTDYGPMIWGELGIAEGTSGKLVAQIRRQAACLAEEQELSLIITDGPPGIGCPVIASLSGIDAAVVVTEPSVSGCHDLQRTLELCAHFEVTPFVVINKWDLNPDMTQEIRASCEESNITVLGYIPFDPLFPKALAAGKLLSQYAPRAKPLKEIEAIWHQLKQANF